MQAIACNSCFTKSKQFMKSRAFQFMMACHQFIAKQFRISHFAFRI